MLWSDLDHHARSLLGRATRSVAIVAPFIKEPALRRLLARVPPAAELAVYTRWRADEIAIGVSDTAALALTEDRGGTLHLVDRLHAKAFVADGGEAMIGSANVTDAALGLSRRPNLELMHVVFDRQAIALFLAAVKAEARIATAADAEAIEAAAALLRRGRQMIEDSPEPAGSEPGPWLPRFRSPDRLHSLYMDVEWLASAGRDEPALSDMVRLAMPAGLDETAFDAAVAQALTASAAVEALEALLDVPQRFGAVAATVGRFLPQADRAQRQAAAQTLIRWLLHFIPERYKVETPNWSEVLSRR